MNILLAAADYMEEHGWTQGFYRNDLGAVCMHGAISLVAGTSSTERVAARLALTEECQAQYGRGTFTVNDDILGDKYEAIDLLKRAAKRLEPTLAER